MLLSYLVPTYLRYVLPCETIRMPEPIGAKVQCIQAAAVVQFSDKCLKVPYLHKVYWTNYQIQLAGR